MSSAWNIVGIAQPTQESPQGGSHERAIGIIKQAIRAVLAYDPHTDIHRAAITACTGKNMSPLISTGLTPMAVVFGRHSVFDFLHHRQFVPEEDETMEDAQHRNMHRIMTARLAVIEQDARDVARVCRLDQVRAHSP